MNIQKSTKFIMTHNNIENKGLQPDTERYVQIYIFFQIKVYLLL